MQKERKICGEKKHVGGRKDGAGYGMKNVREREIK